MGLDRRGGYHNYLVKYNHGVFELDPHDLAHRRVHLHNTIQYNVIKTKRRYAFSRRCTDQHMAGVIIKASWKAGAVLRPVNISRTTQKSLPKLYLYERDLARHFFSRAAAQGFVVSNCRLPCKEGLTGLTGWAVFYRENYLNTNFGSATKH